MAAFDTALHTAAGSTLQTMDAALAGLIGAAIGAAATLAASLLTERARMHGERVNRRANDRRLVRDLCGSAYVDGVEAVIWLSSTYVEDSVDPRFIEEFGPPTATALERARAAREALKRASALSSSPASVLAGQVAVTLGTLDEAWRDAQAYRRKVLAMSDEARSSRMGQFYKRQFDDAYGRLIASRKRLSGFDGNERTREVVEAGGVRAGSLLEDLRVAASNEDDE